MEKFVVTGGKPLTGEVAISGAKNAAVALAEKYGNAVCDAPPRLYDIYVTLYVENNTQASAAAKWGYSEGYIRYLNRQLYAFFKNAFANKNQGR